MIAMTFTIELGIGFAFLLQAALPQLVTDRDTKLLCRARQLIVMRGQADRTAIADARTEDPGSGTSSGSQSAPLAAAVVSPVARPGSPAREIVW